MADATTDETADEFPPIPMLLGLGEMTELFPVAKATVYRWRVVDKNRKRPVLPEPALTISGTPMWHERTVLEFGARLGHKPNPTVLARLRKAQGHG